ncbi:hypothetical protein KSP39_PZI005103 [Platanthera zijinensis]|uniref:Uncharacterized protein n=1 Tax=Platanthera zijinensis TaxID=2320716 RepID=A0AAP0BT58_9ASPA
MQASSSQTIRPPRSITSREVLCCISFLLSGAATDIAPSFCPVHATHARVRA